MLYFSWFSNFDPQTNFKGYFQALRGHIKLGSGSDFVQTLLCDPFVKELELTPNLNDYPNIFGLGASLLALDIFMIYALWGP